MSRAVAGLAREVEGLRRTMATSADLERLAQVVADLADTTRPADTVSETAPSWLTMPRKTRSTRAVLRDLVGWMGSVYLRYADATRTLPECWLWHPDVVEELVWLMHAWLAAYQDDTASVRAAGDWHDRLRPGVVRRIGDYVKACSLESHLPDRASGAPSVPVQDAIDAIAVWWADDRDTPGPAPTDDQMIAAAAAARRARGGAR